MRCFGGIAHSQAVYWAVHALRQYQTKELLLWDRLDSCLLWCLTCIAAIIGAISDNEVLPWDRPDSCLLNALNGYQGNTDRCLGALGVNLCIVFYMLRTCFRGRLGQTRYSYRCMCSLRVGLRVGCAYAWAAIRSQPATSRLHSGRPW